jgi:hypothetical protein
VTLNPLGVVLFAVGAVLIYAAIKDVDPRDVVKQGLGGKAPAPVTGANVPVPKPTNITPGDRRKN